MTKEDLIDALKEIPGNPEVAILQNFNNGSGVLRAINLGPVIQEIDSDEDIDLDTHSGEVVVIGYGNYDIREQK